MRILFSSDTEKLLKFKADCREFAKCLKSHEQFIRETSEQFLKQNAFLTSSCRFLRFDVLEKLRLKIEKNNWGLQTYRNGILLPKLF